MSDSACILVRTEVTLTHLHVRVRRLRNHSAKLSLQATCIGAACSTKYRHTRIKTHDNRVHGAHSHNACTHLAVVDPSSKTDRGLAYAAELATSRSDPEMVGFAQALEYS